MKTSTNSPDAPLSRGGNGMRGIWRKMIVRCSPGEGRGSKFYYERGIRVCEEWRNSYEAFVAHVGQRPSSAHTLDRFPDKHGHYEPGNVRWATAKEQSRNRTNTGLVPYGSKKVSYAELSEMSPLGLSPRVIRRRILRGWYPALATSTPVDTKHCAVTDIELLRSLHDQGLGVSDIAARLDRSPKTVCRLLSSTR